MLRCLLVLSLFAGFSEAAIADGAPPDAADLFSQGVRAYEAGDFRAAAQAFKQATTAAPTIDEYVYWLGKAYGRQAERANWVKAVKLAKLTCATLEHAVQLNPENWDAVSDLARYYEDAPVFLGGDRAKAAKLRTRLQHDAGAAPMATVP